MKLLLLLLLTSLVCADITRTPWTYIRTTTFPTCPPGISQHGAIAEYAQASVPPETANYLPCGSPDTFCTSGDNLGVQAASRLTDCFAHLDFTYFQTFVTIPPGTTISEATIDFTLMDDGARISVYNSQYPDGIISTDSYCYLSQTQSSSFAQFLVAGQNRIIVTQVDDCCCANNIIAEVALNGVTIPPCTLVADQCHTLSYYPNSTCYLSPVTDGTLCDDGNACTTGDSCQSGVCSGQQPTCNLVANQCNTLATDSCGRCTLVPVKNGTTCDDGNSCTCGDSCQNGTCQAGPNVCLPELCACSRLIEIYASFPSWWFGRSLVGNLLGNVVNVVDGILEDVLGLNPVLEVNVGDILRLKITTTSAYPFTIWTSLSGGVYAGFSVQVFTGVGPYPLLTIGADVAGKNLYYICPTQPQMYGIIKVAANTGGLLGTTLNLLGNTVGSLINTAANTVGGLVNGCVSHTYIVNAAFPNWNFIGSLVGELLGGILGNNPVIYANVGDLLTFRVSTTAQYPFTVCITLIGGVCTPYTGWSAPGGYVTGPYPTLLIAADVAGRNLYYTCPSQLNMQGVIQIAAAVDPSTLLGTLPTMTYNCAPAFPNWNFGSPLIGTLLGSVLGLNPVLTVNVGDIITFNVSTTSQYPFTIYSTITANAQVYAGFSAPHGYTGGIAPTLTIGAELSGSVLYYACPTYLQSDHMFGIINVAAVVSLPPLLRLNAGVTLHTYILTPTYPSWKFAGSVVGTVLNSVLGLNPLIQVKVGDVIVLRVATTPAYPFTVSTSNSAISVYVGFSVQASVGYVSGSMPVLVIGDDVAGRDLYYICPGHLNMYGIIRVAALVR